MRLRLEFDIELRHMVFYLDTDALDRNYDDENYAYWIRNDAFGYVHEIHIDKDERGCLLLTGVDNIWKCKEDFEDGRDCYTTERITFIEIDDMTEKELAYKLCHAHGKMLIDKYFGGVTAGGNALGEAYFRHFCGIDSEDAYKGFMAIRHWVSAVGYGGDDNIEVVMSNSIQNC